MRNNFDTAFFEGLQAYINAHQPCKHLIWEGIPEVDAYCKNCLLDEHEVNNEYTRLHKEYEHCLTS